MKAFFSTLVLLVGAVLLFSMGSARADAPHQGLETSDFRVIDPPLYRDAIWLPNPERVAALDLSGLYIFAPDNLQVPLQYWPYNADEAFRDTTPHRLYASRDGRYVLMVGGRYQRLYDTRSGQPLATFSVTGLIRPTQRLLDMEFDAAKAILLLGDDVRRQIVDTVNATILSPTELLNPDTVWAAYVCENYQDGRMGEAGYCNAPMVRLMRGSIPLHTFIMPAQSDNYELVFDAGRGLLAVKYERFEYEPYAYQTGIQVFDTSSFELVQTLEQDVLGSSMIFFLADGSLVEAKKNGQVFVWHVESGALLSSIGVHYPQSADFGGAQPDPSNSRLLLWNDGGLQIITVAGESIIATPNVFTELVASLELSPDGQWLAGLDWNSNIGIYDTATWALQCHIPPIEQSGRSFSDGDYLLFDGTGQRLAVVWETAEIEIYDVPSCERILFYSDTDYRYRDAMRLASGELFMFANGTDSSGGDSALYLMDSSDGRIIQRLNTNRNLGTLDEWVGGLSTTGRPVIVGSYLDTDGFIYALDDGRVQSIRGFVAGTVQRIFSRLDLFAFVTHEASAIFRVDANLSLISVCNNLPKGSGGVISPDGRWLLIVDNYFMTLVSIDDCRVVSQLSAPQNTRNAAILQDATGGTILLANEQGGVVSMRLDILALP